MRAMKALHPHDSSTALANQNQNNAFRLTIAGLVSRTQQFSLQDLRFNFNERSFDSQQTDRFSAHEKSWHGCSLNELIEFVGVSGQARYIEFVFSESAALGAFSIPVTELEHQEIGLVWEQNGQSLSAEEGGPLFALVSGLDGYQPLPGISRINLVIIPCSTNRSGLGPALAA
jgi:DMSO/TMAO reductase YedYZ molybdopterin-dependent catalytic subunit